MFRTLFVLVTLLGLTGCIGTVVGSAVDVAVEVVKVPFKVGGAVVDAVSDDDEGEEREEEEATAAEEWVDGEPALEEEEYVDEGSND